MLTIWENQSFIPKVLNLVTKTDFLKIMPMLAFLQSALVLILATLQIQHY